MFVHWLMILPKVQLAQLCAVSFDILWLMWIWLDAFLLLFLLHFATHWILCQSTILIIDLYNYYTVQSFCFNNNHVYCRSPKVVLKYSKEAQLFKHFHSWLLHNDWMLQIITFICTWRSERTQHATRVEFWPIAPPKKKERKEKKGKSLVLTKVGVFIFMLLTYFNLRA